MTWRSIPSLSCLYEASDDGRIRRAVPPRAGRELLQSDDGRGYRKVSVCVLGKEATVVVHRLVAEAFIGPCPAGCVVNHLDGHKDNNRPENLEYTTPAGNSAHAAATGLAPSGTRHGRHTKPEATARGERVNTARLTEDDVREARGLRAAGWTLPQLCARFGIGKSAMHALCTGKNWSHVR